VDAEKKPKNKRMRFILGLILVLLAAMGTIPFLISGYVKQSTQKYIISAAQAKSVNADCIIILGAGVKKDGKPMDMLKDRLVRGVALYHAGASDTLLMSGDHGRKNYDEVNAMKQYAIDNQVLSEHVFMDHAGFSTYETMYRAKEIFGVKKVLIVTQNYHLYRALYIAKAMGLEAYGVSSDLHTYAGQGFRDKREILARVKDFFSVIFMPKPTYLGDSIPINGNGDQTNDKVFS
jgi:Uncharacterized membrane protein